MAITIVGQGSAAATSVAIPAHAAGDLIIVSARGTAAAPVKPTPAGTVPNWVSIQSALANSIGLTTVGFVATAANHTSGVFTSATHICVIVLRAGAPNTIALGPSSTGNGNNTQTIVYPALTLGKTNSTSIGVRIGTRGVAVAAVGTAPTNWTQRVIQPATPLMAIHTRAALAANPTADSVTTSGTNSAYRAHTVEVQEVPPVTHQGLPFPLTFIWIANTAGQVSTPAKTVYGASSLGASFAAVTAGEVSTPAAPTHFGASSLAVSASVATAARRTTRSSAAVSATFGATTAARRKTFGAVARPSAFAATTAARRVALSSAVLALSATLTSTGSRRTFSSATAPWSFGATTSGTAVTGPQTRYGVTSAAWSFASYAAGRRRTTGQVARPTTYAAVTAARRRTFGAVGVPVSLLRDTKATRRTFGVVARATTVVWVTSGSSIVGPQTYYGVVARPVNLTRAVSGQRKAFAKLAMPISLGQVTAGRRRTFGQVALPVVLDAATLAHLHTYGRVELAVVVTTSVQGRAYGLLMLSLRISDRVLTAARLGHRKLGLVVLADDSIVDAALSARAVSKARLDNRALTRSQL